MKLNLQILIATIIVLAIYIPAAKAEANLTFSGGGGAPLSITLQSSVSYTLTSACRNPVPIFKAVGNPFANSFPLVSGSMTYSINGGAARPLTVANSGITFGDIAPNDILINYPTGGGDPILPIGTTFVINPGTLTSNTNAPGVRPPNGSYTTFLVCSGTGGFRTSTDGNAPTAASVSVSGRVLTGANRGLMNAVVYLTDATGETRAARTNPFGYYRFADIAAGQTVILTVVSKRYQFAPQVLSVTEQISDFDFAALALPE